MHHFPPATRYRAQSVRYMDGAVCAMCFNGVHQVNGRVVCDACEMQTDCCLCPERTLKAAPRALNPGPTPPRLAQHILEQGCRPAPFAAPDTAMPASALRGASVILADTVSTYASAAQSLGEYADPRDLPSLLPPHRRCFLEMRGSGDRSRGWGAYLRTLDLGDPAVLRTVRADLALRSGSQVAGGRARWLVLAGLVVTDPEGLPMGPVLLAHLWLRADGGLAAPLTVATPRLRPESAEAGGDTFRERCTSRYLVPVLVALTFVNCEGAVLERMSPASWRGDAVFERLRVEPFEGMLSQIERTGVGRMDAARQLVPGRFEDVRPPGGARTIRWRPENMRRLLDRVRQA